MSSILPDGSDSKSDPPPFTPQRVLVTGSRNWQDRRAVRQALDDIAFATSFTGLTVVHGHCPTGADHWADEWAEHNADLGVKVERHPAKWSEGKSAGPRRNQQMVDLGADVCLAFFHADSRGTKHCAEAAERAGIPVRRWSE